MRTNSGSDQGRDVNRDPTMKERERSRGRGGTALDANADRRGIGANRVQRPTAIGSHARKAGSKGDRRIG